MEYTVVVVNRDTRLFETRDSVKLARQLADEVNKLIDEGWRPLGGVSVATNSTLAHQQFNQAMIRE